MLRDRSNHSTKECVHYYIKTAVYWSQSHRLNRRLFFWENVFRPPQKPWLWTETKKKKQKALALLYLGSGTLRNTTNSSVNLTEFAARNRQQRWSLSNLNFLLSTKKTTEYSVELFLSIYRYLGRYLIFFPQVLNLTSVQLNRLIC